MEAYKPPINAVNRFEKCIIVETRRYSFNDYSLAKVDRD